jgi:peptidoglycan/LPS O-acetylase OafA/YrhL
VSIHEIKLAGLPTFILFAAALALWVAGLQLEPTMRRLPPMLFCTGACTLALIAFARVTVGVGGGSRLLLSLGNASYGVYLVHLMIIDQLVISLKPYPFSSELSLWGAFALLVAIALPIGWSFGLAEFSFYRWATAPANGSKLWLSPKTLRPE